jgi:hypothetical protein
MRSINQDEETHYTIERRTPREILHYLMEAQGFIHKDVWTLFWLEGRRLRSRQRQAISKTHARALAGFSHVSADLFIGRESVR